MLRHAATLPQRRLYAAANCRAFSRPLVSASASAQPQSSAFTGVHWIKAGGKWRATISHGGKQIHLGRYHSEEEAARTWDKAAVLTRPHDGKLKLNFPRQDYLDAQARPLPDPRIEALLRGDPDDPALAGITSSGKQLASAFRGVCRFRQKWQAQIKHGGKMVQLGQYDSEEEAARTWDKAAVRVRPHDGKLKLNFPLQDYLDAQDKPPPDPRIEALLCGDPDDPALAGITKSGKQLTFTSAFRGVYHMGKKWQAQIKHGGKMVQLGKYDSEEEAARTWDKAAVRIRPHDSIKLNFPLQDYLDEQDRPLPDIHIEALLRGDPALDGKTNSGKQLTSAFRGVSRLGRKWKASIIHGGKLVYLGCYDSEVEAARTWDKAAVLSRPHDGKLKLNFPLQDYLDAQEEKPLPEPRIEASLRGNPADPALAGITKAGKQLTSAFTGVSRNGKSWKARIVHDGKLVHLGSYDSEEEAARTWDKAAVLTRPHDGKLKLNFPQQDYLDAEDKPLPDPRVEALLRGDSDDSALAGITKSGKQLASAVRGVGRKGKQLTSAALKQ